MDIFKTGMQFTFSKKVLAEEYIRQLNELAYKTDVVTVNDVLRLAKRPVQDQYRVPGWKFGYSRKELRKVKPVKSEYGKDYHVILPVPGRMYQDENGYWTTEGGDAT